jgi:hypothetical protein
MPSGAPLVLFQRLGGGRPRLVQLPGEGGDRLALGVKLADQFLLLDREPDPGGDLVSAAGFFRAALSLKRLPWPSRPPALPCENATRPHMKEGFVPTLHPPPRTTLLPGICCRVSSFQFLQHPRQ